MAISIEINGQLRLDQSAGLQDDDIDIDSSLTGLNSNFRTALLALADDLLLSQAQKDFAAEANAASKADYVSVSSDGEAINDLFFSNPDGDLFEGEQVFYLGNPLQTVDGDNIYLWSLSGDLVIATTSSTIDTGDVVAAFYLDEAGDHLSAGVEMVTFIPLAHPDTGSNDETINWSDLLNISVAGSTSFDFDALKSGSSLWVAVGSETGGVLVTGKDADVNPATGKMTNASDVVHTSQGGDGTTIGLDNQLFDIAGETAVFTLVTGLNTITGDDGATGDYVVDPNLNDNKAEGIDYDGYLNVVGAGIYISQSQGSPSTTKSFDINLFSAGSGTTPEEGFGYISGLASDAAVNVGSVTVINDDGVVVGTWGVGGVASGTSLPSTSTNGATNVIVTISGNNIDVDGVFGEFTVTWTSLGGAEFNRFTLVSEAGKFDVGRVDITSGLVITEPVGDTMFVDDDGPSLPPATQDVLELVTDDTDIADSDTLSTDDIFTGAPLYGTDGPSQIDPILYDLRVVGTDPDSGLFDTETGDAILLKKEAGGDVVGIVDEDGSGSIEAGENLVALRWSLSASDPMDLDTETVTFTQYRAVVHGDPSDPEEDGTPGAPQSVNGGLVMLDQTAIDGDEDVSSVSSFDLGAITQLWDDGPSIGGTDEEIADGLVDFASGDSVTNDLEGVVGNDPNTSPYKITAYDSAITVNGVDLEGVLSEGDTVVTYYADTSGNGIFGDAGDTAYYKLELGDQGGSGDYTFTVLVDPPPAFTEFRFDDLPSGSNLFGIVGDADAGLIVFGKDIALKADNTYIANQTQEVKTSQAGLHDTIGIESQMFDPGDAAYFTFVNEPDPNFTGLALGSTEADDADNILYGSTLEGDSAFIRIAQLQGSNDPSMKIELFNIDDDDPQGVAMLAARGVNEAGKDPDITAIRVYDQFGELIEDTNDLAHFNDPDIEVSIVSGVATVTGFGTNYRIEWDSDEDFDQTLITGVAGKFDIGGFGFLQLSATPDQKLDFTAQVTDGDGDSDAASWSIGIDGTGSFDDNIVSGVII